MGKMRKDVATPEDRDLLDRLAHFGHFSGSVIVDRYSDDGRLELITKINRSKKTHHYGTYGYHSREKLRKQLGREERRERRTNCVMAFREMGRGI